MQIDNVTKTVHFDSPAEMARYARDNRCTYDLSEGKWYGYKTTEQSINACIQGDDAVVPEARKLLDQFADSIELSTMALQPDVCGAFPMVPSYLGGDPECFLAIDQQQSQATPLTILIDTTCSGGFKPDQMRQRGTAILALVMALTATRPVRLELFSALDAGRQHRRGGDDVCFLRCSINTAPLDLATAAFCLADVSCPRRIQYGILRRVWESPLTWPSMEGVNAQNPRDPETMRRTLELAGIDGDVLYIPAAILTDHAMNDPKGFVTEMFQRFRGDVAAAH
jgi:hypothetical protein